MEYRVLGPLEVVHGSHDFTPKAAKLRVIVALLVLHCNCTVKVSTLIDEVWGERPPESALPTLQTYIYKIRKILDTQYPDSGAKLLLNNGYGYRLEVPSD